MRSRAEASPSFLYVQEIGALGSTVELSESEAHYVARVCRAVEGDQVSATDGRGVVATLRIVSSGRGVQATIERRERRDRTRLAWLLCGAPEGDRADWLVEKLAELGVSVWQPLETERGAWARAASRGDRWRRLALAALRQARRCHLMEVREPLTIDRALAQVPTEADRWLADSAGEPGSSRRPGPTSVAAIGPSGGFTSAERDSLLAAGFHPICFADGRLRTETAALAWAAWWASG